MLRDLAVAQIKQILGFRSDKDAEIVEGLQFQQEDLENQATLPWFLRAEDTTLVTTVDAERLTPPVGFIREWDEDAVYIKFVEPVTLHETWEPLYKDISPKFLRTSINNRLIDPSSDERRPLAYAFDGTDFLLFPTPDAVYELKMIFYKKDALLTTNIENKWLKRLPYLLIGKAGLILAASLRDKDAVSVFAAFVATGMKQLNDVTTDRDMAGAKLVIGGSD